MLRLVLYELDCLTLRRCSMISFIYIFTIQIWHVLTTFIFLLIMLWIFSTFPPPPPPQFPLVHLFYSYLCGKQAISAPAAHKYNERENTVLQHSHCLSNRLQHHWERNREVPFISLKSCSRQVLPLITFPATSPLASSNQ